MQEIVFQTSVLFGSLACACFFFWKTRPVVPQADREAYLFAAILCMAMLPVLLLHLSSTSGETSISAFLALGIIFFLSQNTSFTPNEVPVYPLLLLLITIPSGVLLCLRAVASATKSLRAFGILMGLAYTLFLGEYLYRCLIVYVEYHRSGSALNDEQNIIHLSVLASATLAWLLLCWHRWQYGDLAYLRHIAARKRLCPVCGYSLRGLPPGASCPECGQVLQTHEKSLPANRREHAHNDPATD